MEKKRRRREGEGGASLSSSHPRHGETTTSATVSGAEKDRDCRDHDVGEEEFGKEQEPVRCFCFVVIVLLHVFFFSSSRFFQPSQLSFFSLDFFSLMRCSFFFFFRILGVPFSLVSKKQGREKDSGVLYASASFPGRRISWRRR